jgi:RimJ/RimL family protein N-acetyltransferase
MQTFETARLLMRPLQLEDEAFYCACYTDPVLMQHIGEPLSHEAALRSFTAALKIATQIPLRHYTWVMQDIQSRYDIGLLGLVCDQTNPEPVNAQIGAIIFSRFQNRGFAAESINALVDFSFKTTALLTLSTRHETQNQSAKGLMQKLGFLLLPGQSELNASCNWQLQRTTWGENHIICS